MRTFLVIFASLFLLTSCNNSSKKGERILSSSSGNINHLSVVASNILWENNVGEAVRNILAAPLVGLPQDEPLFSIRQMPPEVFSGFAAKNRTVLKIEKGPKQAMQIKTNLYAKPQLVIVVSGKTDQEIITELSANAKKIVDAFKKEEIKEKQRRIKLSLQNTAVIKDQLGVEIKFPSAYRIAKQNENFFWIRKTVSAGTVDFVLYQVPYNTIQKGESTVNDIVKMRDSVGKIHIEGENEGSYMITEEAYTPSLYETILDNKSSFETRGIWDMKNDYMSGPFINYAIEDKVNNRYIIAEGYAYAPSVDKRDYIFELEAIIKSIKID